MSFFITVFTPTYNRADKLERVYKSLLRQSLKQLNGTCVFEWLIIDDGSDDGTRHVVERWKRKADFPVRYIYQENMGKIRAIENALKAVESEFFLIADSDDAFSPETIDFFYKTYHDLSEQKKKECGSIGVLCQDQYGRLMGCGYPVTNKLIPTKTIVFRWPSKKLGETWALIKCDMLRQFFVIPDNASHLKFIPESFFWVKMAFGSGQSALYANKILRTYYRGEENSLSSRVRRNYAQGFEYESLYFVNHYPFLIFQSPIIFLRHVLKYTIYTIYLGRRIVPGAQRIESKWNKLLYIFFCLPAWIIKGFYLKERE